MGKTQIFAEKKLFATLFIGLFVILLLPLSFMGYFFFNVHSNMVTFDKLSSLNEHVVNDMEQIDLFLQEVHGDVLFLSKLSSLNDIINSNEGKGELEQDFLAFSNEKKIFHQIRYIDENGQEIVSINSEEGVSEIIRDDLHLHKKGERYYFTETMGLELGEIFISPLDLNVEHEVIENRGTEENPAYVPVIRYATPVFDNQGNSKGIIIINVYAEHLLYHLHEEQKKGEFMLLIDHNGFYLSHPDFDKEFGFMFDKDETIYNDYPEIAESILSNQETEIMELGENLVSFRYIYPKEDITEIEERESHIEENGEEGIIRGTVKELEETNFWVLVDIKPKEEVFSPSDRLGSEFLLIILSTMFIVGLAFVIFFILISKRFKESRR
jgi:methyl-accepting chemotaxis protein